MDLPKPAFSVGTDSRSPKAEHIRQNAQVELCYWFEQNSQQFRIAGKAFIVDSASSDAVWLNERRRYFDTLKETRRKHYATRGGPGTPVGDLSTSPLDDEDLAKEIAALYNYALIVLRVENVDWVSQVEHARSRWTFNKEGEDWQKEELVL